MLALMACVFILDLKLEIQWQKPLEQIGIWESHRKNLLAVGEKDTLIFRDSANSKILFVDAHGNKLGTAGGRGQGPGEFHRPEGLAWMEAGKVVVAERSVNRLHFFDIKGNYLSSQTTKIFLRFPVFGPDRIYCLKGDFSGYEPTIMMYSVKTDQAKQLYASEMSWPNPRMIWSPNLLFAAGSEFLAIHESHAPQIKVIDPETGQIQKVFNLKVPRKALSDETFHRGKNQFLARAGDKGANSLKLKIDKTRPDFWPVLGNLLVDNQHQIWAFLPNDDSSSDTEFVVYNRKGERLASGQFPGRAHAVHNQFLYAIHEDEDLVEHLTKYRIQ